MGNKGNREIRGIGKQDNRGKRVRIGG